MTPHDPVRAAAEELSGMHDALRTISTLTRAAERKLAEAEAEFNALTKVARLFACMVEAQQAKVQMLRAKAEAEAKT